MPLPDQLERLKHISIDTLGLSESTSALLKWNGLTHVLDCVAFFYRTAQDRNAGRPWSLLFTLMFGEVKPALITAGYWDLVLDAEVWRVFREQKYEIPLRMVVCWQGRDIDLYEVPSEQLGLTERPPQVGHFKSIGHCIHVCIFFFKYDANHWYQTLKHRRPFSDNPQLYKYMFELAQPRLVELGYWAFVEAHIDDFDLEQEVNLRFWESLDDSRFYDGLLQLLLLPLMIVASILLLIIGLLQEGCKRLTNAFITVPGGPQ